MQEFEDSIYNYTISIVIIGEFNPAIIQPFWLAQKKLISESDAQEAQIELIHKDISKFSFDWASIDVQRKRFEIKTTKDAYFEPIKDLAYSIVTLMESSIYQSIGINHIIESDLRDSERYYKFGNKLSPLNNWTPFLNNPKLLLLEIFDDKRDDGNKGNYRISISPSDPKFKLNFGICFNINDHFSIENPGTTKSGEEILKILNDNWRKSQNKASSVCNQIWEKLSV